MSNSTIYNRFHLNAETISLVKIYYRSIFVIKYGGSIMKDELLQSYLIQDIVLLSSFGINIILVHGGGYIINNWLEKLNIDSKFYNGVRITDRYAIEVVEMVLSGKVNKKLVSCLNKNNLLSVGLSGKDANLIVGSSLSGKFDDYTGKIDCINPSILLNLLSNRFIPVISSIAFDVYGNTYNINADTAASHIASSLKVDKYILLTDTLGVLKNVGESNTLIKNLSIEEATQLKVDGVISGGMIPKLDSCIYSLSHGVKEAHIIDGKIRHVLLHEIFTLNRLGSRIIK